MSKTLINPVSVPPLDLKLGDVMAVTVTCHVRQIYEDNTIEVSLYRCPYPDAQVTPEGIPQGGKMFFKTYEEMEVFLGKLFPVINIRNYRGAG